MIRKGIRFRATNTIVMLTLDAEQRQGLIDKGILPSDQTGVGYVIPARAVPVHKPVPANAFKTNYTWAHEVYVHAVPIKVTGWSRTNMPYVRLGSKDKVLWFEDGRAFVASL